MKELIKCKIESIDKFEQMIYDYDSNGDLMDDIDVNRILEDLHFQKSNLIEALQKAKEEDAPTPLKESRTKGNVKKSLEQGRQAPSPPPIKQPNKEQDGKTEQLSAEEFLKSKVMEWKTSMSYYYSFSGHEIADLLEEYSNQSDDFQLQRLYDWIMDENREPAKTKFTAGTLRNVANEIEFRLKQTKVSISDEEIEEEINGKLKMKIEWYDDGSNLSVVSSTEKVNKVECLGMLEVAKQHFLNQKKREQLNK